MDSAGLRCPFVCPVRWQLSRGPLWVRGEILLSLLWEVGSRYVHHSLTFGDILANCMCLQIGFAVGLALGGVLTDSIGWQWGFYISAIFDTAIFAIALWGLPNSIDSPADGVGAADLTWSQKWSQMVNEIDWVGALIASASLAMLSYVFAYDKPYLWHERSADCLQNHHRQHCVHQAACEHCIALHRFRIDSSFCLLGRSSRKGWKASHHSGMNFLSTLRRQR